MNYWILLKTPWGYIRCLLAAFLWSLLTVVQKPNQQSVYCDFEHLLDGWRWVLEISRFLWGFRVKYSLVISLNLYHLFNQHCRYVSSNHIRHSCFFLANWPKKVFILFWVAILFVWPLCCLAQTHDSQVLSSHNLWWLLQEQSFEWRFKRNM